MGHFLEVNLRRTTFYIHYFYTRICTGPILTLIHFVQLNTLAAVRSIGWLEPLKQSLEPKFTLRPDCYMAVSSGGRLRFVQAVVMDVFGEYRFD